MPGFTWECLGEFSCETCPVQEYIAENPDISDTQKTEMFELATAANIDLIEGISSVEVLKSLGSNAILSSEEIAITVKSVQQWDRDKCWQNSVIE